ncbi:MAG: hypothetical protein KAV98_06675 [Dehalococcoidia bacterium]|nr:hypothetical protein [Dehalococcoidia bacterium]
MEQKQDTNQPGDEMTAYNILVRRHINDDRLMGESGSAFFAGNSILFLGFVMLVQFFQSSRILCIIIPILGFGLCLLAFCSNRRTGIGLDFWEEHEKKLEKGGCSFAYMREKQMVPHLVYQSVEKAKMGWLLKRMRNRIIYAYCIPAIFLILWVGSLIWVLRLN